MLPHRATEQDGVTEVMEAPPVQSRLTFASLLRGGVEAAVGVNARWLRTARNLVVNAGRTAAEYVRGVRDRYSHPVAYALASISAYVIARAVTTPEGSLMGFFDPVLILDTWWPYLVLPLLAPAAFVLPALFRRAGRTAAEAYVLILYVAAQIALLETAWTAAAWLGAPDWIEWGLRAVQAVYAVGAVVAFGEDRRWHGWLRAVLVVAVGLAPLVAVQVYFVWGFVRLIGP